MAENLKACCTGYHWTAHYTSSSSLSSEADFDTQTLEKKKKQPLYHYIVVVLFDITNVLYMFNYRYITHFKINNIQSIERFVVSKTVVLLNIFCGNGNTFYPKIL